MTAAAKTRRPTLADISLHRDLYAEICDERDFTPRGLPAGTAPLPSLSPGTVYAEVCDEQGFTPASTP